MDPLDAYARFLFETGIFLWGQRDEAGRPYSFSLEGLREGRAVERLSHFFAKLLATKKPVEGGLKLWSPIDNPPLAWIVAQSLWSEFQIDSQIREDASLWLLDTPVSGGATTIDTVLVALDTQEPRQEQSDLSIWSLGDMTAVVASLAKQQLVPSQAEDGLRRHLLAAALRN